MTQEEEINSCSPPKKDKFLKIITSGDFCDSTNTRNDLRAMAQDGHHAGHQGADAFDVNGIPPSEIVTNPANPRDSNSNQGEAAAGGADVVAAEDEATKGKRKAVAVDNEAPPPQFMLFRERRMRMNEKFAELSSLLPKSTKKVRLSRARG
jgi:hypothetical protein